MIIKRNIDLRHGVEDSSFIVEGSSPVISYTYSSRVRLLYFFFIFSPILTGFSREGHNVYFIERASYYQCANPTIIVRQHDQGASVSTLSRRIEQMRTEYYYLFAAMEL